MRCCCTTLICSGVFLVHGIGWFRMAHSYRGYNRTSDYMLLLIIAYPIIFSMLPQLSPTTIIALHFAHACAWCLFHCVGLGLLIQAQGKNKFIVRHFLKNYHYPPNDGGKGAIQEAFSNWKSLYNLSLCMTYSKFAEIYYRICGELIGLNCSLVYWAGVEDVLDSA